MAPHSERKQASKESYEASALKRKEAMKLRRPDPDPLIPIRNFAPLEERAIKPHAKIAAVWPKEKVMVDICDQENAVLANAHCINGRHKVMSSCLFSPNLMPRRAPAHLVWCCRHRWKAWTPASGTSILRTVRCMARLRDDQADVVVKKHEGIGSGTPEFWKVFFCLGWLGRQE
jgi:hypothetical protein